MDLYANAANALGENGGIEFSREEIVSMSHLAFDEYRFKDSLSLVKFGAKGGGEMESSSISWA